MTPAAPTTVVVEGCVATEREIKGHPSGLGERTGLNNHFVLTAATVIKGRAPAAVSAPGGAMYGIEGLTDEQLKLHVGRRVRIDGHFDRLDHGGAATDASDAGRAELTAATIRQVPGDCSAATP